MNSPNELDSFLFVFFDQVMPNHLHKKEFIDGENLNESLCEKFVLDWSNFLRRWCRRGILEFWYIGNTDCLMKNILRIVKCLGFENFSLEWKKLKNFTQK